MSKDEWKKALLDGAGSYFEYKKKKAQVNLENYLHNPAGIGEHPDLVQECIKLIEEIEHAEGCLSVVNNNNK